MRIGIDYTPAVRQHGGIGRYTRELVGALLAQDSSHRYTLFAAVGGVNAEEWTSGQGTARVAFRSFPVSDDWLARIWHRLRLPIPVETITGIVDTFYSPDFVLPPTLPHARTLLTVHDLSFLLYPEHFVPKLVRYLTTVVPRSIARADRVLADSESTRDDLISQYDTPPDKVEVLYSGADSRFQPSPTSGEQERLQARYRIGKRPYVLSVGTLQPRKNYVNLIRAFARLECGTQLLIAGGWGWLYECVFAEAEKHNDRVHLLGLVDDADLPALYRNAALFALPSLYEGFGLPVLEAMACGIPVVCSDCSSLPEVAGDAALLVDPCDPDAIAAAMTTVLTDDDQRIEMVSRGLAQASRFTWDKAARQLLDVFDSLANDRRAD